MNKNNTAALLGKACIHFLAHKYREALSCYKQALEGNPTCPVCSTPSLGCSLAGCRRRC